MVLPNILNSNSILSPATAIIDLALKEVLVFFPSRPVSYPSLYHSQAIVRELLGNIFSLFLDILGGPKG